MDESVGSSVACVLGEKEPNTPSRNRNKPWEVRLELVFPFFCETQTGVPGNCASSFLDSKDWHDLFFHSARILFK
jgi:hypothetical protein